MQIYLISRALKLCYAKLATSMLTEVNEINEMFQIVCLMNECS